MYDAIKVFESWDTGKQRDDRALVGGCKQRDTEAHGKYGNGAPRACPSCRLGVGGHIADLNSQT